jgi:hypothetical protein
MVDRAMLHSPVLGDKEMSQKRMKQNWCIEPDIEDFKPFLSKFEGYLKGTGSIISAFSRRAR